MRKSLYTFLAFIVLLGGCSKNSFFPADTRVYDSPENYPVVFNSYDFNSSQGARLKGWHFYSQGEARGMVVVANGMIYNMSERFKEWTWLLSEGYDLFIFDYRGYGASEGEVDMHGFVDDVASAIAFAHALEPTLPMAVVGQSMGGSFVIDAVSREAYPYVKLLIIDSTMTRFGLSAQEIMQRNILLWPWSWLPVAMTPSGVDAIEFVDRTVTPMLFLTGVDDQVILPSHSIDLFLKAKEPKAIWIVAKAGHVECIHDERLKRDLSATITARLQGMEPFSRDVRYYDERPQEE